MQKSNYLNSFICVINMCVIVESTECMTVNMHSDLVLHRFFSSSQIKKSKSVKNFESFQRPVQQRIESQSKRCHKSLKATKSTGMSKEIVRSRSMENITLQGSDIRGLRQYADVLQVTKAEANKDYTSVPQELIRVLCGGYVTYDIANTAYWNFEKVKAGFQADRSMQISSLLDYVRIQRKNGYSLDEVSLLQQWRAGRFDIRETAGPFDDFDYQCGL